MNPDVQILLAEIQKLAAEQASIQELLADQKDLLQRPFIEVDASRGKLSRDTDAAIIDTVVVPDNWGRLFEELDHTSEERSLDLSVQIRTPEFKAEPMRLLDFGPGPDEYTLTSKPVDSTWSSPHHRETIVGLHLLDSGEPEYIPVSDKELEVVEVDEKVLLTGNEVFAIVMQTNTEQLFTERPHVSALVRDSLAQRAREFNFVLGGGEFVFASVNKQQLHNDFDPLDGYDGSLGNDPSSGVAHFDALRDQAAGRVVQPPVGVAALRADVVGAAGGGFLASVVAAGPLQAACSMICPAGDRSFANVSIDALWEEMHHGNNDNRGLSPVSFIAELKLYSFSTCVDATMPTTVRPAAISIPVQVVFDKIQRKYNTVVYPLHSNGVAQFGPVSTIQEAPEIFEEMAKHISEILWQPCMHISNMLCTASISSALSLVDKSMQNCFSIPFSCSLDAVLYRQHRPWPPPLELRLVTSDAGMCPLPWPSFHMVESGALEALLVYDSTRCQSFDHIFHWLDEFRAPADKNIVLLLVGKKSDLEEQQAVSTEDAKEFVEKENLFFLETSALLETNTASTFPTVLTEIFKIHIRCVLIDLAVPWEYMMILAVSVVAMCDGLGMRPIPWPSFWYCAVEFGSRIATCRLLVYYELLKQRISWGDFLHLTSFSIFHEFTVQWCCVFDRGMCFHLGGILAKKLSDAQKPIASVCHEQLILVATRVIEKRTCTTYPVVAPVWAIAGANWEEPDVIEKCTAAL